MIQSFVCIMLVQQAKFVFKGVSRRQMTNVMQKGA